MEQKISEQSNKLLCIIGLGYVGLPLLMAFSRFRPVIGYDNNSTRIKELAEGYDRNGAFTSKDFFDADVLFTAEEADILAAQIYVVCVPTPITPYKTPDLNPIANVCSIVGKHLKKQDLVVFESTVYPGCTQEFCVPILEKHSGLKVSTDFYLGYSPERINPGDKVHKLANTIKIVSGIDGPSTKRVRHLYGQILNDKLHIAPTIKVAEAAKIVENIQRDVNIALVNELSLIFDRLDIDTFDVVEAAGSKWNFQKYYPGLVGGHCISVDPYYLTYKSEEVGYYPEVILSGRKVNESIVKNVTNKVLQMIGKQDVNLSDSRVLIMGITFKENVRDTRNSKVFDLIHYLQSYHIDVEVLDPHADRDEIDSTQSIHFVDNPQGKYHCLVLAVKHEEFTSMSADELHALTLPDGGIIDVKGIYRDLELNRMYWTL